MALDDVMPAKVTYITLAEFSPLTMKLNMRRLMR